MTQQNKQTETVYTITGQEMAVLSEIENFITKIAEAATGAGQLGSLNDAKSLAAMLALGEETARLNLTKLQVVKEKIRKRGPQPQPVDITPTRTGE